MTAGADTSAGSATRSRDSGRVLWLATAGAWLVTVALMLVPAAMWGMPAMAASGLAGDAAAPVWIVGVFLAGWVVMVVAMMLPTTVPMVRALAVVTADVPARRRVLAAFAAAYGAVWLAMGLLGLAVATTVTWAGAPDGVVLAGALALAGAFQFSPWKTRCLTLCREPRGFLFAHYRRGVGAAWSLGLRHAAVCVGCCWALMAVMFATGSGGLLWMLGLTAVMVAEKTAPWGRRLVVPVGVALLLSAAVVAVTTVLAPAAAPMHHM